MLRWLILVIALGVGTSSAEAQVFKPKAKKTEKAPKKAEPKAKRDTPVKKRVTKKAKKKNSSADRARRDDSSDSGSKGSDKDYVKIWDDETIE